MLQEQRSVSKATSMSSSTSSELSASTASRKSELVQSYFDDAKKFVSRALKLDEKGERMSALELYNKALSTLQSGLAVLHSASQLNAGLKELKGKMEKVKEQVKSRMQTLLDEESQSRSPPKERPSSHSSPQAQSRSQSRSTVGQTTRSVGRATESSVVTGSPGGGDRARLAVGAEADLIFSTSVGGKVFHMDGSGRVSRCTSAEAVNVFRYKRRIQGQPPAFLQCGDFVYPLIPGKSPILHSSGGAYIFSELGETEDEQGGGSVGVVLNSISPEEMRELDHVLSVLADFRLSSWTPSGGGDAGSAPSPRAPSGTSDKQEEKPSWGTTVAGKIDVGVSWVSSKLSAGTDKASGAIAKGGDRLRDDIEPNEKPAEIPEPVVVGAHCARKVTGAVVGVSDFLMTALAKGTVAVGKKAGSAIASSDMVKEMDVNPHAKEAWKVTKSSAKAAGKVFVDLERGARTLIKAAGGETSKTVEHKYGEQAGKLTDDSLHTAGHVADLASTYWSWKTWGIRFLGKVGGVISSSEDTEKCKDDQHLRETIPPATLPSVVPSAPSVVGDNSLGYSLPTPPRSLPPPYQTYDPRPTEKLLYN